MKEKKKIFDFRLVGIFILFLIVFIGSVKFLPHNASGSSIRFLEDNQISERIEIVTINKIWGGEKHSGFTTLIEFNGYLYCAFRVGENHNSRDGIIELIRSSDGVKWEESSKFSVSGIDLRDPKLSVNSKNELVLIGMGRSAIKNNNKHISYTWKLEEEKWTRPNSNKKLENTWMWGIGKVGSRIMSIAYSGKDKSGTLYSSQNGEHWDKIVGDIFPEINNYPNESALIELKDQTIVSLLRKDKGDKMAKLGTSFPPYTKWTWVNLDKQIGGPSLIQLPNEEIFACVRLYNPVRTSICKLDMDKYTLDEVLELPSGNDTSYAGMVMFNGFWYISYYSNHEVGKGKAAIYLVKIKI